MSEGDSGAGQSAPRDSARKGYKRHPNSGDLYTPITDDLLAILNRMRDQHTSWRRVAAISGTKLKVLRNVRHGRRKAISQRLWDRLTTTTGVGSINDVPWFTADDLVTMGIWKEPMYVEGEKRIQRGLSTVDVHHGHKSPARREADRLKKRAKKIAMTPRPNPFGITKPRWLR